MFYSILGWLAVILTSMQFIPQVIKSLRTKELKDVSLGSFLLVTAAASTWILYGVYSNDLVIITANVLVLTSALIISLLKITTKENIK